MNSFNKFAIVSVSLVACLVLVVSANEFQEEYDQINQYLEENVKDAKDSMDYMEKAEDWLNSMGLFTQIKDRLRRGPDARIAPALRQLMALKDVQNNKCDFHEFEILRRNELATGGRGRQAGSERPIDKIVFQFSMDHATHCHNEYPLQYIFWQHDLDEDLAQRVESLHKFYLRNVSYAGAFENEWAANKEIDVYDFLKGLKDPKVTKDIMSINIEPLDVAKAIVSLARRFPKATILNSVMSMDFQSAEFYSLLLKPCDHYTTRMDLFYGAQYDEELLKGVNGEQPAEVDEQWFDFYLGWSKFNLCKAIWDNQNELKQFWLENWDTPAVSGHAAAPVVEAPVESIDVENQETEQ